MIFGKSKGAVKGRWCIIFSTILILFIMTHLNISMQVKGFAKGCVKLYKA